MQTAAAQKKMLTTSENLKNCKYKIIFEYETLYRLKNSFTAIVSFPLKKNLFFRLLKQPFKHILFRLLNYNKLSGKLQNNIFQNDFSRFTTTVIVFITGYVRSNIFHNFFYESIALILKEILALCFKL